MAYIVTQGTEVTVQPSNGEPWKTVADRDYRFEFHAAKRSGQRYSFALNRLLSMTVQDTDVRKVDPHSRLHGPRNSWTGR